MANRFPLILAAGLLTASCAVGTRPPSPHAEVQGTWTLVGQVEADGTEFPLPPDFATTFTVDMEAGIIVKRTAWVNVTPPMPDMVCTWPFTVTRDGNWIVEDVAPGVESIEVAVTCAPGSLTLTRIRYEGPGEVVPPPAATEAEALPLPDPERRPPPKVLRFSR